VRDRGVVLPVSAGVSFHLPPDHRLVPPDRLTDLGLTRRARMPIWIIPRSLRPRLLPGPSSVGAGSARPQPRSCSQASSAHSAPTSFPGRAHRPDTPRGLKERHPATRQVNELGAGIPGNLHHSERCYDHMTLPSVAPRNCQMALIIDILHEDTGSSFVDLSQISRATGFGGIHGQR
jgi:hypothetical protein